MQEVATRTAGKLRLSPGTLYGSIKRMLEHGGIYDWRHQPKNGGCKSAFPTKLWRTHSCVQRSHSCERFSGLTRLAPPLSVQSLGGKSVGRFTARQLPFLVSLRFMPMQMTGRIRRSEKLASAGAELTAR
jgi:hypothetical protein